ncbi:hypothetical protein [Streptomyces sp. NPDC007088]|uniref:hypothetical protein n=1 Tax=Streptomyces sp. NPDC007088 TaxID=3364773 RepID=UPI0036851D95
MPPLGEPGAEAGGDGFHQFRSGGTVEQVRVGTITVEPGAPTAVGGVHAAHRGEVPP